MEKLPHQEYRDDLAHKLKSEKDKEKRKLLRDILINSGAVGAGRKYEYIRAKIDKLDLSESTSHSQILFFNEREKKEALNLLSQQMKTGYGQFYIPLRLEKTLLGKVLYEIQEQLMWSRDHLGDHDLFDFLQSIPVGADLSEWSKKVSEKLDIAEEESVPVGVQLDKREEGVPVIDDEDQLFDEMVIRDSLGKNAWANIGGIDFEKMVEPGNQFGGNLRNEREELLMNIQSEWVDRKDELQRGSDQVLNTDLVTFDELKKTYQWGHRLTPEFGEELEMREYEKVEDFCNSVNRGKKFRLELGTYIDPSNADEICFWLDDELGSAGPLFTEELRLEDDRKSTIPFSVFLKAAQISLPLRDYPNEVGVNNAYFRKTGNKYSIGKGIKIRELFSIIKNKYPDQFVGIF